MLLNKIVGGLALLALCATSSFAQVSVQGRHKVLGSPFANVALQDNGGRFEAAPQSAVPFFDLPYQDNDLLALEDQYERTRSVALTRFSLPFKFAKAVNVLTDFFSAATLTTLANGDKVYRWGVRSAGAHSLSVLFDQFRLPEGAEFFVYNEHETLGAFTASVNNKAHLEFSVRPIRGSYVVLEYFEPAHLVRNVEPLIEVTQVAHGFVNIAASGSCNINVACRDWGPQIHSVGMLLTDTNQRYCSGSLINNARQDGRQLFLTANHCMSSSPTKHIILFNYEAATCSGTTGPTTSTVQGLTLLAQYSSSDFALLEVQEKIPDKYDVYLSGFSASPTEPFNPVGIHHPSGDIKKISFYNSSSIETCWNECPKKYHWEVSAWTEGTTEPGSSGSPLFDGRTHNIIGQLHGGTASCSLRNGYDSYGKVASSWATSTVAKERLKEFLDPDNTGVLEVDGISLAAARQGGAKH